MVKHEMYQETKVQAHVILQNLFTSEVEKALFQTWQNTCLSVAEPIKQQSSDFVTALYLKEGVPVFRSRFVPAESMH